MSEYERGRTVKPKRIVVKPWAWRRNGAWLMGWEGLEAVLRQGDVLEFGGLEVGAATLLRIVRAMRGGYDCLIRANERLEIETGNHEVRYDAKGKRHVSRKKPGFHNWVAIAPGAWLPREPKVIISMRLRKLHKL